jgi:hypothetical protein
VKRLVVCLSFLIATTISCATLTSAAPLKGGVKVEDEGTTGQPQTPTGALLDKLQAELQELRQLNARLEKAAGGERRPTAVFPMKIDAVDKRLRPNKLFTEADLPHEDTEEGWYRIPEWRAGKFHREKQVDHGLYGDTAIVSRVDHVYGMQRDASGGIWHHRSWPHVTKVEMNGYVEYKIIESYEPIEGAPNEFAFKVSSTDIDVDPKTNKIKRVTKQQEVDRYHPEGDLAVGECEWQGYTADGNPNTQVERSTVEEVKTEPFRVVNKWKQQDLRSSFIKYLESHGMADLVPQSDAEAKF